MNEEYENTLPPGSVISRHGTNLGEHRGSLTTISYSGGRKQIIRRTPEQIAEIRAELDRQDEEQSRIGKVDKLGGVTITTEDVKGMSPEQWLSLPGDVREGLLRGVDQTGVRFDRGGSR
jgi:hypothetical protein